MCATGDDAEVILAQAHDRQVALEATVDAENRGVNNAANSNVHLTNGRLLNRCQGAWADDVEDREGGQVSQASGLTHLQVLSVDDR